MCNTKVIGKRITALTMTTFFALSIFGIPYTQTKSVVEAKHIFKQIQDGLGFGGGSKSTDSDNKGDDGMLSSMIMGMMGGIPMGSGAT